MSDGNSVSRKGRTSVWLEERPTPRRRGSGQDREKITAAAVRLLDAEGLAQFSMRRLATQLGVTAMSVYWYVDRKDDLLELALDAVAAELEPPRATEDWRTQLRHVARELRVLLHRHPWASELLGNHLNVGPHAVAYESAARRVLRRAGIPARQLSGAVSALFSFVHGYSTAEATRNSRAREAGLGPDDYVRTVRAGIQRRPEYSAGEPVCLPGEEGERDFWVALDCVISGIDTLRAQPVPPGPGEGAEGRVFRNTQA